MQPFQQSRQDILNTNSGVRVDFKVSFVAGDFTALIFEDSTHMSMFPLYAEIWDIQNSEKPVEIIRSTASLSRMSVKVIEALNKLDKEKHGT